MDLGFAMDSSSSLGPRNYLKEKDFVKKIATHVGLRPDGSRVGVLIYGENSMIEITMGHHRDSRSFGSRVDRLPFYSQRKKIDSALKTAKFMFKVPPQSPRVSKVLVLLVNGKQTLTSGYIPLSQAAGPLRNAGVRIIVIGVGNVSANELRSVAANSRDVYLIPSFDVLLSQVENFKRIICEGKAQICTAFLLVCRVLDLSMFSVIKYKLRASALCALMKHLSLARPIVFPLQNVPFSNLS